MDKAFVGFVAAWDVTLSADEIEALYSGADPDTIRPESRMDKEIDDESHT